MTLLLPERGRITLGHKLGMGGEGVVYSVAEMPDLAAKVLFDADQEAAERIQALTRLPPAGWRTGDTGEHLHVAWPLTQVLAESRQPCGYLMPRIEGRLLTTLFDARSRQATLNEPTWHTCITVAARISRLYDMLHDAGIVIGDVSPANILVSVTGHVTLIDCETVQFTDRDSGRTWPATKVTPEYAPPGFRTGPPLTPEHDGFGLAVLVAQLLMEGEHPFEGIPRVGADTTIDQNIARDNNRITRPGSFLPVVGATSLDALPAAVLVLLRQCFGPGRDDPGERPTPAEWGQVLNMAGYAVRGCERNSRHFSPAARATCTWCDRAAAGLGDSYPDSTGTSVPPPRPAPAVPPAASATTPTTSPTAPAFPVPPPSLEPAPPLYPVPGVLTGSNGSSVPAKASGTGRTGGDPGFPPALGWLIAALVVIIVLALVFH